MIFFGGVGGFWFNIPTIVQSCWDGAVASWVFTSTLGSSGVG